MNGQNTCLTCGNATRSETPGGLCPACLFQVGMRDSSSLASAFDPVPSSVLGRLADSFGDCTVPHVLLRDTVAGEQPSAVVRPAADGMPHAADGSTPLQLLGEIARGGMGAVLKGRDPDLGRDVAVKVLLEKHGKAPELIRRFVEEAQISGQLQHPGIVPIYDLGAFADHRPYFTMKLVKGRTLASLLAERDEPTSASLRRFLSIFGSICQTMAYAHARGVIHRDLKPSNVMVGSFGEVQVMDWGLAKVLPQGGTTDDESASTPPKEETVISTARSDKDLEAALSRAGSVVGTPAYMSPEQARGEVDILDERTDVFALGSMLCEILTGHPAFTGRSSGEIHRQAARGDVDPALERLKTCDSDAELIELARACLAPASEDRPRHAGQVAAQIEAYEAGVQARLRQAEIARVEEKARAEEAQRTAAAAEARAKAERHARQVTAALAATILLTAATLGGGWMWIEKGRAERRAAVQSASAEARLLWNQARTAASEDMPHWPEAMSAIHQAQQLAKLANEPHLTREVSNLQAQMDQDHQAAQADRRLLERLAEIRDAEVDDIERSEVLTMDADKEYEFAFLEAGFDPLSATPDKLAERIKAKPATVARAIVGGLDDWARFRRDRKSRKGADWATIVAIVRAADPDPIRDELRGIWLAPDPKAKLDRLKQLAHEADVETWPVQTLSLLALITAQYGENEVATKLLKRSVVRHPGDVWINHTLGELLEKTSPEKPDEAIRFYTAARALRPTLTHTLAHALERHDKSEALALFHESVRLRPEAGAIRICLSDALVAVGDLEGAKSASERAVDVLRERVRRNDRNAWSRYHLGGALDKLAKLDGKTQSNGELQYLVVRSTEDGRQYFQKFGRDEDKNYAFWPVGGLASGKWSAVNQKILSEAIQEIREAVRLDPQEVHFHASLAVLLDDDMNIARNQNEAEQELREAIRLQPGNASYHNRLGSFLSGQSRDAEAIKELIASLDLAPNYVAPRVNLGALYHSQNQFDQAERVLREAIRLDPHDAEAHCNLGHALKGKGDLENALASFKQGHELGSRRATWEYPSERWIRDCEAAIRMKGFLKGEGTPTSSVEHLAFANLLVKEMRYEEARTHYKESVRTDPENVDHANTTAWLLATSPNPQLRDGKAALKFAAKACELTESKNAAYLDTLAAAHAEAGDFDAAVKVQTQAIELLTDEEEKADYATRLQLYQNKQPYHQPPAPAPSDAPPSSP